jgi:Zn-dependent protease with chaperone function
MKRLLLGVSIMLSMTACTSTQNINKQRAINAGTAAVTAFTISDSQIVNLCKEYMIESDKENTVLPASDAYTQRLNKIMKKFTNISDMNVNYAVYQSNIVNAFASGDGSIRIYSGLMDKMNDDEVFAVIGHELGHLKNKDTRDSYRAAYIAVAAREGIAAVNSNAALITDGIIGQLAQELATSAYSRQQEYAADEAAFQFCVNNNVDPYAMYNALNVLIALNKGSNSNIVTQMFSTHPDSEKRAARIKSMADELGKGASKPATSATIQPKAGSNTGTSIKPATISGNTNGTGSKPIKMKVGKN